MSNFYFSLSYKGQSVPFQEMSGVSEEMEIEEHSGDGENQFQNKLPNPSIKTLKLNRGIVPKDAELLVWCAKTIQGFSTPVETNNIVIHLLNTSGKVMQAWTFHEAFPVKYILSDLKSENNTVIIESIEFTYSYFSTSKTT